MLSRGLQGLGGLSILWSFVGDSKGTLCFNCSDHYNL